MSSKRMIGLIAKVIRETIPLVAEAVFARPPAKEAPAEGLGGEPIPHPETLGGEPCESCAHGALLDAENFLEEAVKRRGEERREKFRGFVKATRHAESHLTGHHDDLAAKARSLRKRGELCLWSEECEAPSKAEVEGLMDEVVKRAPREQVVEYLKKIEREG